jgi:segregation and condensation protein A
MNEQMQADDPQQQPNAGPPVEPWEAPLPEDAPGEGEALLVDIEGFEGPLDLLLALARLQKVDLARISMVALADQYLAFIAAAHTLRLAIAADYLVMAAWLAFLKSKLLLPKEMHEPADPSGEELAALLSFRLKRLEAMRNAAAQLLTRKRLGRDVFARGMPEAVKTVRDTTYTAQIYDLLKAYALQRQRTAAKRVHVVKARTVWSIKEARERLERLVGRSAGGWVQLDLFLEQYAVPGQAGPDLGRTVLASSFGASLELAREGLVELRQDAPFAPIYMRRRDGDGPWQQVD